MSLLYSQGAAADTPGQSTSKRNAGMAGDNQEQCLGLKTKHRRNGLRATNPPRNASTQTHFLWRLLNAAKAANSGRRAVLHDCYGALRVPVRAPHLLNAFYRERPSRIVGQRVQDHQVRGPQALEITKGVYACGRA